MMIEIRGVHPIQAPEPVHLADVAIDGPFSDVDWGAITQSDPQRPRENWQAVYDEQELAPLPDGRARAMFFFHYLDLTRPLETASGPLPLPRPTPLPDELSGVEYMAP